MSSRRIVGLVFVVIGIVALVAGGVFWTDRDKVLDAGPLQISKTEKKGIAVPPLVGALALVGGIVLLIAPERRRV